MERKVKYDYAFKLECVELVLKKHYSDGYVSKLKQHSAFSITIPLLKLMFWFQML